MNRKWRHERDTSSWYWKSDKKIRSGKKQHGMRNRAVFFKIFTYFYIVSYFCIRASICACVSAKFPLLLISKEQWERYNSSDA